MAMGTRRQRRRQERLWVGHRELAKGPAHPFGRFFLDCFCEPCQLWTRKERGNSVFPPFGFRSQRNRRYFR
jgi:hypothetical protein